MGRPFSFVRMGHKAAFGLLWRPAKAGYRAEIGHDHMATSTWSITISSRSGARIDRSCRDTIFAGDCLSATRVALQGRKQGEQFVAGV